MQMRIDHLFDDIIMLVSRLWRWSSFSSSKPPQPQTDHVTVQKGPRREIEPALCCLYLELNMLPSAVKPVFSGAFPPIGDLAMMKWQAQWPWLANRNSTKELVQYDGAGGAMHGRSLETQ